VKYRLSPIACRWRRKSCGWMANTYVENSVPQNFSRTPSISMQKMNTSLKKAMRSIGTGRSIVMSSTVLQTIGETNSMLMVATSGTAVVI